jgi:hypothetical protein
VLLNCYTSTKKHSHSQQGSPVKNTPQPHNHAPLFLSCRKTTTPDSLIMLFSSFRNLKKQASDRGEPTSVRTGFTDLFLSLTDIRINLYLLRDLLPIAAVRTGWFAIQHLILFL